MNRSDFLKKLGLGAVIVVATPKILAEAKEEKHNDRFSVKFIEPCIITSPYHQHSLVYDDNNCSCATWALAQRLEEQIWGLKF